MRKKAKQSSSGDRESSPPRRRESQDSQTPARKEELSVLRAERDDLMGRLQRVSADYLNYQKRVRRDITETREFANTELIRNLLGMLDDMERALEAARVNHAEDDPLLTGMQMVHDKAMETLGKFGLTVIEAIDKPFDPDKHSAMMQEPSDVHPPQTVLRELQKGYQLKGRTIRPTAVVVSTGGQGPGGAQAPPEEDQSSEAEDDKDKPGTG